MKIQTIFSIAAMGVLAVGCKESAPRHQNTAAAGGEVRGAAIAKLQEPAPEPIKPAAPEVKPAAIAVETEAAEPKVDITEVAKTAALETAQPVLDTVLAENTAEVVADVKPAAAISIPEKTVKVAALNTAEADVKPAPVVAEETDKNPAPKKPAEVETESEYKDVGFDKLAGFEYEVPEEEYDPDKKPDPKNQPDQIPADVKAFNNKRVALKGFMMPLKVEDGLITEMLIMRDQSACCYGTVPKINEWVSVKMTGKGVKPIMDQTITVYGRLKVGEMRENGYLIGIYEMDGEKITGPLDF